MPDDKLDVVDVVVVVVVAVEPGSVDEWVPVVSVCEAVVVVVKFDTSFSSLTGLDLRVDLDRNLMLSSKPGLRERFRLPGEFRVCGRRPLIPPFGLHSVLLLASS